MLTPEQIEERKNYIGGSDVAGILGLSRWSSPLRVWAEKRGLIEPDDLSEVLEVELGNELEDFIARKFMKRTGKKLVRHKETIHHPKHPFLAANVDRLVVGEDAGFEAKTTNAWKHREWQDEEIPQEYILQCMHYINVTGKQRWYLDGLIGNHEIKSRVLDRDEINQTKNVLLEIEKKLVSFWNDFVLTGIQPTFIRANDTDTLAQLFPNAVEGTIIQLTDEFNKKVEELAAISSDKKSLDLRENQIKNEFKATIKTNEIGDTGLYKISWKNIHAGGYTVEPKDYRKMHIAKIKQVTDTE